MRQLLAGLLVVSLLAALGCTRKQATPPGANPPAVGSEPPVSGQPAGGQLPDLVKQYLKQGQKSPDAQWLAAAVPDTAAADVVGVWVARADLSSGQRVSTGFSATAGPPIWMPGGALLFARADDTWMTAAPNAWSPEEFVPALLRGKNVYIRGSAFSPDGSQFIYGIRDGDKTEVWLAGVDGRNIRQIGVDVTAGFRDGELVWAPMGK